MGFEAFIAKRHLTRRHKTGFISLISIISMAGVGVGVMALIVVLAVMSGFDRELKSKIVNVQPHLRIERIGGLTNAEAEIRRIRAEKLKGVRDIAAFVEGQAIVRSRVTATGVIVKGLDAKNEDLSVYSGNLLYGTLDFNDTILQTTKRRFFFFKKRVTRRMGSLILGEELARRLRVSVGDEVSLIAPFQDPRKPLSIASAETRVFMVKGIFRLGMNDFDTGLVLVHLDQARELYHMGNRVSGISVRFHNVDDAERMKFRLRAVFSADTVLRSWYDMNHNFFQALKVEKSVMSILLALIILVAAFNIVSTLTMVVMEKTKDVGILRAIGATRAAVRRIFLLEGFAIGVFGVIAGALAGLGVAANLNPISDFLKKTTGLEVFPSDIYFFDRIPAEIHASDVAVIVGFALLASVAAGLYPADRAARLDPVEALRYE